MSRVLCGLTALLLAGGAQSALQGQARFWLSPQGLDQGSAPPASTLEFNQPLGSDRSIFVWARPDAGQTLENFSLNLVTYDDVLEFSGVQVHNTLNNATERFERILDSNHNLDLEDQIVCFPDGADVLEHELPERALWGFRGVTINGGNQGLGAATLANDPNYDAVNNAWLLATVTISPQQLGHAELFLHVGEIGMNYLGGTSTELNVRLGDPNDAALNAKTDRCLESATAEAIVSVIEPIPGDFNFNGELDANDIDLLSAEVVAKTNSISFNLAGDANVNQLDREVWVQDLFGTFFGDGDLNKQVDFPDFLNFSANFNTNGGWAQGDFDGDSKVAFPDFLLLSANFGNVAPAAASEVVPEPSGGQCVFLACLLGGAFARRRRW